MLQGMEHALPEQRETRSPILHSAELDAQNSGADVILPNSKLRVYHDDTYLTDDSGEGRPYDAATYQLPKYRLSTA
jgi:hypothetical protein